MDIERLKNKILYIAMLISVAMIFLTMHNSLDYSYEEQEFVIAILIPIMYIVINIYMLLFFLLLLVHSLHIAFMIFIGK